MPEPYSSFPDPWPSFPPPPVTVPQTLDIDDLPRPSLFGFLFRWVVFLGVLAAAVIFVWNVFFDVEEEVMETDTIIIETPSSKIIGPEGGEVRLYDGASIIIPEGALDRDILISIEKIRQGNVTDLYHLKPDYLKFISEVTVSIPYRREPSRLYIGKNETQLISPHRVIIDQEKRLAITKLSGF